MTQGSVPSTPPRVAPGAATETSAAASTRGSGLVADFGDHPSWLTGVLFHGFAAALAVWITWFITHLPWLGMPEPAALGTILVVWLGMLVWAGMARAGKSAVLVAVLAGMVATAPGLLALGTKLTTPPAAYTGNSQSPTVAVELMPSAPLIVAGFVGLGAVLGLIGGLVGQSLSGRRGAATAGGEGAVVGGRGWLGRFALLTVVAVTPLMFVGGLVTSTASGMAVPDWPGTFGSNMFLYPLGPRAAPGVYLEHTHRLFGALVGFITLTLLVLAFRFEPRAWVKRWAVAAFAAVCLQGVLGGLRVRYGSATLADDNKWWSFAHGIAGQLTLAVLVCVAVYMSAAYRRWRGESARQGTPRLVRMLATATLHLTIIQLIMGAAWRHLRTPHALWTHIGLALLLMIIGLMAGLAALRLVKERGGPRAVAVAGWLVTITLSVQFALGWVAFLATGTLPDVTSHVQTLIRTAHQANGAVVLAAVTMLALWGQLISRKTPVPNATAPNTTLPA